MATFWITTAFLIGYGLNILMLSNTIVSSEDPDRRRYSVIAIFITLLAAAGTIYLAGH